MYSSKALMVIISTLTVFLLSACGQKPSATVSFGDRKRAIDESYTRRYSNAEDIGNQTARALALTQKAQDNSGDIEDTIMFLAINQSFSSVTQMKDAFAKNYSKLLGYDSIRDETITIACEKQK